MIIELDKTYLTIGGKLVKIIEAFTKDEIGLVGVLENGKYVGYDENGICNISEYNILKEYSVKDN